MTVYFGKFLWDWLYNILLKSYLAIMAKGKSSVVDDKFDLIVSNSSQRQHVEQNGTPQGKQKIAAHSQWCRRMNTQGQIHAQV